MNSSNSNKKLIYLIISVFVFSSWTGKSQNDSNFVWKPFILSNHPLQMFNSRMNHNFSFNSRSHHQVSFSLSRGNVWLPRVDALHLLDQKDQDEYQAYVWHIRQGKYEESIIKPNTESESLQADGVFSTYYLEWAGPISKMFDFNIGFKMNQINKGIQPYSFLTSDATLEWFHSNIAGGEDPFARKEFEYNQNNLSYSDRNNRSINISNNKLFVTEIGADLFYYPESRFLNKYKLKTNIGLHTFASVIEDNLNFDIGLAVSINKTLRTTQKSIWTMGISLSSIAPKTVEANVVSVQENKLTNSLEAHWNYIRFLKKERQFIFGINYHLQSSIQPTSQMDNIILMGDRKSSHWNYAVRKLYEPLQAWTFIGSLKAGSFTYSTFFREDFVVDNSPDFQVGWGISYQFN